MGTMILISSVAILVALVGSAIIWRLDIARADEIEEQAPPERVSKSHRLRGRFDGEQPALPAHD